MERGKRFEERVGNLLESLRTKYPRQVKVAHQHPASLSSGRKVLIDFQVMVDFPHERQAYYFELQSRNRHSHELADKVEAIRRDTRLSTFSFVHEAPLSGAVANELAARNIVAYDWNALVRFIEGIELQLLNLESAAREAKGQPAHDARSKSRLIELVERLGASEEEKNVRHFMGSGLSDRKRGAMEEIAKEVARDPGGALRQARRFFGL